MAVLVDVRLNPVSRKHEFSKRRLRQAFKDSGIEYVHEKELGNPQDNRDSFRSGDGEADSSRMRSMLNDGAGEALTRSGPDDARQPAGRTAPPDTDRASGMAGTGDDGVTRRGRLS